MNSLFDIFTEENFSPLPNIPTLSDLKNAILEGGKFKSEAGNIFEAGGFDRLMHQLELARMHCMRLDQKSVAQILMFHEEIKEQVYSR